MVSAPQRNRRSGRVCYVESRKRVVAARVGGISDVPAQEVEILFAVERLHLFVGGAVRPVHLNGMLRATR